MRDRQQKARRRFKTGQWVEYDGLYSDDWGGDLMLMQGDLFPVHPLMGVTNWTYAGQTSIHYSKSPKMNGHHIGY
ncbi:hypothetical protein L1N85_04715 [Paenibacillus alkaliterrae]|uniref:hypothetical protein n=1 Tax=Paenibacillus alkaliterrae TaxID=320909 RepID=UPI001F20B582|nr:hypothetical protein [Paenibacillus alkaliterrae]MCF2937737.1 hypothetical protein [Paenibacillus alkaliterrae]